MLEKVYSAKKLKKRTLFSFSILFLGLTGSILGYNFVKHQQPVDETPKFLRSVLEFNEMIWMKILDPEKTDKICSGPPVKGSPSRVNGDVGLEDPLDPKNWKMTVSTVMSEKAQDILTVTMDDLLKLPRTEILNQFKCIEGWSQVMAFSGVRFIDFLERYHLGTHSGQSVDLKNRPDDLYSYVGMETPDGEYYVSIDMKSMLSPQTVLAYDMNGFPLSAQHGAPLRLAIPNKYGVKNIKRIGKIVFSDVKLPDYWGERGYDWFIGL